MKSFGRVISLAAAATILQGSEIDLYLLGSTLSPRPDSRDGTIDSLTGHRLGKTVYRGGDFRQIGLGGAASILSPGNWRLWAGLEATTSSSGTPLNLRYLRFQGLSEYSAATDGSLKATTLAPILSLVYVTAGAGEYGISYEHHLTRVSYDVASNVVVAGDTTPPNVPMSLSKRFSDPFLSLNATFVQRYRSFGFFARVSYGMNLASVRSLHDLNESDFLETRDALIEMGRPRQELKLSLGTRF